MYCQLTHCHAMWQCTPVQAPLAIHEEVSPIEPTLAQELKLFERLHKQDLGDYLGVRRNRKVTTTFTLTLPYRTEVAGSKKEWSDIRSSGFERRLAGHEAVIKFGPRARDVSIVSDRATGVVTERCSYATHAATSCMPPPPSCEIR